MAFQIRKRGGRRVVAQPEFTRVGDTVIIGSARWLDGGRRHERYQVLTLRDGKIVDMQSCATRQQAERLVRRRQG